MNTSERLLASALTHHRAGRLPEAEALYLRVLAKKPRQPDALHLLGVLLHQSGRVEEGIAAIRRAIAIRPAAIYFSNLGNALQDLGRFVEAVDCYYRAIADRPDFAEAHNNLGNALRVLGEHEAAEQALRRAVEIEPGYAAAHLNLGDLLSEGGNHREAFLSYEIAVRLEPECAAAWCHLGVAQRACGDPEQAIASYRRALEHSPYLAAAHVNLGNVLRDIGRLEEAISAYQQGLTLAPDSAESHGNLGEAYREAGRPCDAVECQRRAVELQPDAPDAHYELARALLTIGDFENGWREYQWLESKRSEHAAPRWDGSPLQGRSLRIGCREPLGTQLLFASILPEVAAQRDSIVLECQPRLVSLFQRSFPELLVRELGPIIGAAAVESRPTSDLHIPLGGLAAIFRRNLAEFPRRCGYLAADRARRTAWRQRLARLSDRAGRKLVVGISWQAGAAPEERRKRKIPLDLWSPILATPGVTFVNLEHGDAKFEVPIGQSSNAAVLHTLPGLEPIRDVDGFAALVSELDLVISADNSAAQLAGALGVPVWTLLPVGADWRWLTARDDSPWFPSMRLFRQVQRGDWSPVVIAAADALRRAIARWPWPNDGEPKAA